MGKIVSNIGAANAAISGIKSITVHKGKQVALGKSTIPSMKRKTEMNNHLLSDLSQLVDCVVTQSEKFPQIAELIALQDRQITF